MMKIFKYLIIFCLFVVVFVYGLVVDKYKLFPYKFIRDIQKEANTRIKLAEYKIEADESFKILNNVVNEDEVYKLATIKNDNDISKVRNYLIERVFYSLDDFKNSQPHKVQKVDNLNNYIRSENYLAGSNIEITEFTSILKHDFELKNYLFSNKNNANEENRDLVIFINEYRNFDKNYILFNDKADIFAEYLKNNFDVILISNPFEGWNNSHNTPKKYVTEKYGTITGPFESSLRFILLQNENFSPLNYYFQPILEIINFMDNNNALSNYNDIYMFGTGPGGWATTVYSAMDTRIKYSAAASGSIPLYSRGVQMEDYGHWEYYGADIYNQISYLDLYILASEGKDRKHTEAYNEYNSYCYWGFKAQHYKKGINKISNSLKHINFKLFIHEEGRIHENLMENTFNYNKFKKLF